MNHRLHHVLKHKFAVVVTVGVVVTISLTSIVIVQSQSAPVKFQEARASGPTPVVGVKEIPEEAPTQVQDGAPVPIADNPVVRTAPPTATPTVEINRARIKATPTLRPTRPISIPFELIQPATPAVYFMDLADCSILGCDPDLPAPTPIELDPDLRLRVSPPARLECPYCPQNERLSEAEIDKLIGADQATLAQLKEIALSQKAYEIAPGIIYLVSDHVHHVVIDTRDSGVQLRNIIPPIPDRQTQETIRIPPSYCLSPDSLVVATADYHGLVGSNKTEEGRELFYHLGRAALYKRDGRYFIDVIEERAIWNRTSVSWGGGPLYIYNSEYDFNPKDEWFEPKNLEHYRSVRLAKMAVAVSKDGRYIFLSTSYGLTQEELAENLIELGDRWDLPIDRGMRFDGGDSSYIAIRMGDYMVPILEGEEPLIVNCFAVEQAR